MTLFNSLMKDVKDCAKLVSEREKSDEDESESFAHSGVQGNALQRLIDEGAALHGQGYANLLKLQFDELFEAGHQTKAAIALLCSQSHAFLHQMSVQYSKRMKQKKKQNEPLSTENITEDDVAEDILRGSIKLPPIGSKECDDLLHQIILKFPQDWRIVQITVDNVKDVRFKKTPSDEPIMETNLPLIITSVSNWFGSKMDCSVVKVPKLEKDDRKSIMATHMDIMEEHRQLYKKNEDFKPKEYKEARLRLDDELVSLLNSIENNWLGYAKVMLLGMPKSETRITDIKAAIDEVCEKLKSPQLLQKQLLFDLLDGSSVLSVDQIQSGSFAIASSQKEAKEIAKVVLQFKKTHPDEGVQRSPVVLILDREIQRLPWEALSHLNGQPMSRVPSIFFLSTLYDLHKQNKNSVAQLGVQKENVFYILNPNRDLKKTEQRLAEPFQNRNLGEGVVGQWPPGPKIQEALAKKDAFLYFGHGHVFKTLTNQEIEKLQMHAVPLLFGCNSGRLERLGRGFDPTGTPSSYLIATPPALLGFLWSVTDVDLDQWTIQFLDYWLGHDGTSQKRDFVRSVAEMRSKFSRFLNGASTVVYGLPTFLNA